MSIYRNEFAIRIDIRLGASEKREAVWISIFPAGRKQWRRKLQAFFDKEVLPRHRAWLEHVATSREAPPFMADLQAEGARGGPVESRPA